MKSIRIHRYGGPEVLEYEETPVPQPGRGEAVVEIAAIGVNFIDTQYRSGMYKAPALPFTPGMEAAGTVYAVGEGVTELRVGDRVAYAMALGAYAAYAPVPAWKLVALPADVSFDEAAALMLQGLTAHYLTHSTFPLKPGQTALVHAAAGGAGYLLTQVAKKCGATVYATAGTEAKAELARSAGADAVIVYSQQNFETEVKRLTNGAGVDVVYDNVGKDTFEKSLNCLRPRGYMVFYGQSSGPVPPIDPAILGAKGSLFLTRPGLPAHIADRAELLWRAQDLFRWLAAGDLKLLIGQTFPLERAALAHQELVERRTTGKTLLLL
jgi:NADPH2:quinone reductase